MGELKKIVLKGLLLIALLAGLNWIYQQFFFPADQHLHSESGEMLWGVRDSADILYLGESSDVTVGDQDRDKSSISTMLGTYYPGLRVGAVSRGALHAGNFYHLLTNVPSGSHVRTVIVSMNLRSFDATWIHSKLETALEKEMVLLKPGPLLWRRFMLSLRNYVIKSTDQLAAEVRQQWLSDTLVMPAPFPYATMLAWDSAIAWKHDLLMDSSIVRGDGDIDLACHFVKNFAFQIDTLTNPRIRDFDRIVQLAQDRKWNLVLNLLPENMKNARLLVGQELVDIMRHNRDLLQARYGHLPGVVFVDGLETLETRDFLDKTWPSEHYLEQGRRQVADRLARAISPFHPGQLHAPAPIKTMLPSTHFNDCEGQTIWGQMQTLDDGHGHSGSKSSYTGGKGAKFGITFSAAVADLDTTALDSLDFTCWVYQDGGSQNAAIAWESSGEETAYLWDTIQLRQLVHNDQRWQQIHFRLALWPSLSAADIVKVYPYNPSKESIWFDDIQITFIKKQNSK